MLGFIFELEVGVGVGVSGLEVGLGFGPRLGSKLRSKRAGCTLEQLWAVDLNSFDSDACLPLLRK